MGNTLISYYNLADSATFSSLVGAAANYPVTNLADGDIDKPWRTPTAPGIKGFRFSRTAAAQCSALALVNHNFAATAVVRFRVGTASFDADFGLGVSTDDRITYSGGANATYWNWQGAMVSGAAPRIDFDPITKVSKGLLIEEGRTNRILQSRTLSNASWTKSGVTTPSTITGPDSTASMTLVREDGTTAFHEISQAVTLTANAYDSWHAIVKAGTGTRHIHMALSHANGSVLSQFTNTGGVFSAGTISSSGVNPFTNLLNGVVSLGNGLYWLWMVAKAGATIGAGPTALLRLDNGTGAAYLGDSTSGHYMGFAQLEAGSKPTSQIHTTTTSVTRTADTVVVSGASFTSGWYNTAGGTLYSEFNIGFDSPESLFPTIASIQDGTTSNLMMLYAATVNDSGAGKVTSSGVDSANLASAVSALTYRVVHKSAMSFMLNDYKFCMNGGTVATDVSGAMPAVTPTQMVLGGLAGSTTLNGHVKRLVYWPYTLTSTQLQALTTTGPTTLDYDSGFINAKQMTFSAPVPADWGAIYDVIHYFGARTVQYGIVEFSDPDNASNYGQIGRVFMGAVDFKPAVGAAYGLTRGWEDLSTNNESAYGKDFTSYRPRRRVEVCTFSDLTAAEGKQAYELLGSVGITEEVLYLPNVTSAEDCQQFGMVGKIRDLDMLKYPLFNNVEAGFQIKKKK